MLKKIFLLLVLVVGVGYAALSLAPAPKEMALMEMEDNEKASALKHYTELYEQGDHSINVMGPLVQLYTHYGLVDKAIAMLETVSREGHYSADSLRQMASLYRTSQRFYAYCEKLEELQKIKPSAQILRELADTYDFMGEHVMAGDALARLVKSNDYITEETDYYKLASYYHIKGQSDDALATIEDFLDNPKTEFSMDMIELGLYILLENGQDQHALEVARHYLKKHPKEEYAIALSQRFEEYGHPETALLVLDPFLKDLDGRSSYLLQQIVTLYEKLGRREDAYKLLMARFNQGTMPEMLATWLIDLSVDRRQFDLAEKLLNGITPTYLQEDVLLRYAAMATQINRPKVAILLKEKLGTAYLRETPLLSALLEVGIAPTPAAMGTLVALQNSISTPERRLLIADIYALRGRLKEAYSLLEDIEPVDMLASIDGSHLADIYLTAGAAEKGILLFRTAENDVNPKLRSRAQQAVLLLAAGRGNSEAVTEAIKGKPEPRLLEDAYYIAERHGQAGPMFILAEHLYDIQPTQRHRIQLAQALLLHREHDKALGMFAEAIQDVPQTPAMRELAAELKQKQLGSSSELFFLALAQPNLALSPQANELVAYWHEHLGGDALRWMESRAGKASDGEKIVWVAHLNAINHPESVIAVLQGASRLPSAAVNEYIRALAATRSTPALSRVLTQELAHETDEKRQMWLIKQARENNLPAVASAGFRRIYALHPDNMMAVRELALLEASSSHYAEAAELLEKYLGAQEGDYRVHYAYAEILQRRGEKERAKQHYTHAYTALAGLRQKDRTAQVDEARLLFRTNRTGEAIRRYDALLTRYPKDAEIRADYAEMLIAAKRYDEASLVLKP